MKWAPLVRTMTTINTVLVIVIAPLSWLFFFSYGARPDGVRPAWYFWFGILWYFGPAWSVASLLVAAIKLKKSRETRANAWITAAYVLLWGMALAL